MTNHWIVTPFFLDAPEPALRRLAQPGSHICEARSSLAAEVEQAVARGARPVSVAGDCCATIPVLAGLQRAGIDPVIVWLDAHGDFNMHETTITGFVGGMPLAMITGRGDQSMIRAAGATTLPDTQIILADARDLDPAERQLLAHSGVTRTDDFESIVDLIGGRRFYVHFDVDVIDGNEAPAMKYRVTGGPSVERLRRVAERLHATGGLVAASMTPWEIDRDTDGRTAAACWQVFRALVGEA